MMRMSDVRASGWLMCDTIGVTRTFMIAEQNSETCQPLLSHSFETAPPQNPHKVLQMHRLCPVIVIRPRHGNCLRLLWPGQCSSTSSICSGDHAETRIFTRDTSRL